MKNRLKTLLLISVAISIAPVASAQSSSTEARLQALEAMVAQLRAELAAEKAQTDNDLVMLEKKAEAIVSPTAPTKKGSGFQVGDTTFKLGGFVDFDAHVSNFSEGALAGGSGGRDFHIPFTIPVGTTGDGSTVTDLTAQATRFSVTGERDVAGKKATAYIETDFLLAGNGNCLLYTSPSPRDRQKSRMPSSA